ncbi:hypothetical protein DMC30DRAFT_429508 [Rhodotorula diobovata]|uniref:Arginase n=1 Tax=Rhodotorula diobovata TaxID=5288 RepID=A0A5C5FNU7_9BASI|nr:hypothetical protein DMC30DRAFT_429508 [Rhodotorula diobovata]
MSLGEPQQKPTYEYRHLKAAQPTIGLVCAPFSGGQPRPGVETGPLQLIESGLVGDIENLGWKVDFAGADTLVSSSLVSDKPDPDIGILKKPRLVSKVNQEVSERVYKHSSNGQLTVTIGGDHSLAMGTVSGTFKQHPDAALIWVDAHADINTPLTTPSGNLHGCPVSFLMGLPGTSKEEIPEYAWIEPVLKAERLVYIGLRDIDAGERKILKENNIKAFSMHHVDKYGIGKVVEMALEHVGKDRPIHLSFDVDALDPTVAPSTGTAVRGGLTFREGHYICEALAETGRLVSLDIMEINPSIAAMEGDVQQTVDVGRSLIRCALGETLL